MANETIIFQANKFFVNVAGKRVTAMPEVGVMATIARLATRSTLVLAGFGTSAHALASSKGKLLTVNLLANSSDDAWMWRVAEAIEKTGSLAAVSLVYGTTQFISGGLSVVDDPERSFAADGVEFMAWQMHGVFSVGNVGTFIAPDALTPGQFSPG